jgi:hypothetical protein
MTEEFAAAVELALVDELGIAIEQLRDIVDVARAIGVSPRDLDDSGELDDSSVIGPTSNGSETPLESPIRP